MGIEWNHVDLARNIAQQLGKLARLLFGIVDAAQQDIFEGNALAPRYRQRAAAIEQLLERIFAIDRHQFAAQLIVGRVQRDR